MKHSPLAHLRKSYSKSSLSELTAATDPYEQFKPWFEENMKFNPAEPNAMVLSTVGEAGRPSSRIVLLKWYDASVGFLFFSNYESRKGRELKTNPLASILFYWPEQERQVRIEGKVKKVSRTLSEEYFHSRPRGSQVGAWASDQSQPVPNREFIDRINQELEKFFKAYEPVPLPPFWGGYTLVPDYFEFWQGREDRLHDRIAYRLKRKKWSIERLSP